MGQYNLVADPHAIHPGQVHEWISRFNSLPGAPVFLSPAGNRAIQRSLSVIAQGPGAIGIPRRALACLAGLVALWTSSLPCSIADAMSVRDILYLNKYGEGATDVSWCSDQTITFVTHGPSREFSLSTPDYSRFTTVNMFSIETQQVRPVIVSDNAAFGADCVRGGEYVFLNGGLDSAMATDARRPAQALFSQFIDVRPRTGLQQVTPVLQVRREDLGFRNPLRTAPDGSVYAAASSGVIDLDSIVPSKRSALIAKGLDYSLVREDMRITFANADTRKLPPGPFPLYAFSFPEIWGLGSYDCSTNRPGCTLDSSGPPVGYYLFTKINTDRARLDVLFTVTPRHEPLVRRWPVMSRSAAHEFTIAGVALDSKRCYVLLEPNPGVAESRVNGRLKLDLYIAQCSFTANRLEYDRPQLVAHKQASFTMPTLSLNDDFVVISETTDFASQDEDQVEFERAAIDRPNICARFLRATSWPLVPVNTICVRQAKDGADGLSVSPEGGFVSIRGGTPLIVGREYRNDGTGPAWLNHGEQP